MKHNGKDGKLHGKRKDGENKENDVEIIGDHYQDAPDEGSGDVPTEDKIIRDPDTGEETLIRNANKKP